MPVLPSGVDRLSPTPRDGVVTYDPSVTTSGGRALVSGIDAFAQQVEQKRQKTNQLQLANARSDFQTAQIAAEDKYRDDPDFLTAPKRYASEMQVARQKAAATLGDDDSRAVFDYDTRVDMARGISTIRGIARAKNVDFNQGDYFTRTSRNRDAFVATQDPAAREALVKTQAQIVDGMAQKGFLTYEQAAEEKDKTAHDWAEAAIGAMPVPEQLKMLAPQTPSDGKVNLAKLITSAAARGGVLPEPIMKLVNIESAGDPFAVNPTNPNVVGLGQFDAATARSVGVNNRTDAAQSVEGIVSLWKKNAEYLQDKTGKKPEDWQLYLAHQQGGPQTAALLSKPDDNVVEVLTPIYKDRQRAIRAVIKNGGDPSMSAGDFTGMWKQGFADAKPVDDAQMPVYQPTGTLADHLRPDQRVAMYRKALGDHQDGQAELSTKAIQIVDQGGYPPPDMLVQMDAGERDKVKTYYNQTNGFEAISPEDELRRDQTFQQLQSDYARDPKSIMGYTPVGLRTTLNEDDFKKVMEWRGTVGAGGNTLKERQANEGDQAEAKKAYTRQLNIKGDVADGFNRAFQESYDAWSARHDRAPTKAEIYSEIGDPLALDIAFGSGHAWWPDTTYKGYELKEHAADLDYSTVVVPQAERNQIVQAWRRDKGEDYRAPTEEEIRDKFLSTIKDIQ